MNEVLKLVMTFENEDGGKVNLSIVDPRHDIEEQEIKEQKEYIEKVKRIRYIWTKSIIFS